ncbi:MAG: cyclic nucleotide-binding domain-containing protein [Spirochaetes bacterium]|nr:cyclic nucleotide-binding domain-containing protein [Spirochaetota bacterium]
MDKYDAQFKAGTIIFKENDVDDTMYFIKSGKVEILKTINNSEKIIDILKTGDFFGEMAIVNKSPRFATARAITDVLAVALNREKFLNIITTQGEIALKIIDVLCLRLKNANGQVKKLIQKNEKALVYDALVNWLQVVGNKAEIDLASKEISNQLHIEINSVKKSINKLVMINLLSMNGHEISLSEDTANDKLKALLQE